MMRMRREEEDDDYVILKRFVVLSLKQILSKSQESESSEHTNIFVSLRNSLKNPDKISCTDLWGVLYVGRDKAGDQKLKIIGCYRYSVGPITSSLSLL